MGFSEARSQDILDVHEVARAIDCEIAQMQAAETRVVMPEIPGERYISAAFEALEHEHIWRKSWLCAGRIDDLARAGDYRVFRKAGPPILIVRGKDDILRAFYNTCRHRGAPVVRGEEGHSKLLRCQFHSWSYNLEGKLIGVPEEGGFGCLDRSKRSLLEVRCETWGGWVFVNLDDDAEPLMNALASLPEDLTSANMEALRLVDRRTYRINANWKVTLDAFNESYHLNTIHPNTAGAVNDAFSSAIGLLNGGHSWQASRRRQFLAENMVGDQTKPDIAGMDEKFREFGITYNIFPNWVSPIDPVGFPVLLMWPIDRETSEIEIYFVGPDWGDQERPSFYDDYFAFFDQLIAEDIENLAPMQESLMSGAFTGALLNFNERKIYWHHQTMDERIGAANIPASMRVPPVLCAGGKSERGAVQ